jgi:hypothetical protein
VGGRHYTHIVKDNQISVGGDQWVTVGQSRSTTVPKDSVLTGEWSVTIANGLGAEIAGAVANVLDGSVFSSLGPLAPVATSLAAKFTGPVMDIFKSKGPFGGTPLTTAMRGPFSMFQAALPAKFKQVASMLSGPLSSLFNSMPMFKPKLPTSIHMVDKKITLTTGAGAMIQLDDGKITLFAKEGIFLEGGNQIDLLAGSMLSIQAGEEPEDPNPANPSRVGNVDIRGFAGVSISTERMASISAGWVSLKGVRGASMSVEDGDLICKGGPNIYLNPDCTEDDMPPGEPWSVEKCHSPEENGPGSDGQETADPPPQENADPTPSTAPGEDDQTADPPPQENADPTPSTAPGEDDQTAEEPQN